MKRIIKTTIFAYLAGVVLTFLATISYFYFRSIYFFLAVFTISFAISYTMPFWFQLLFKAKLYKGNLRQKILDQARSYKVSLVEIYEKKSDRSNATAMGFANTKRIFIDSNTLQKHPTAEIEAVIAHELGHHKNLDVYRLTALVAATLAILSALNLYLYDFFEFQNLITLVYISAATFLPALLILLAINRKIEDQADKFAFKKLKNPEQLGNFLTRAMEQDKVQKKQLDKNIHSLFKLFLTHRFIYERIKLSQTA